MCRDDWLPVASGSCLVLTEAADRSGRGNGSALARSSPFGDLQWPRVVSAIPKSTTEVALNEKGIMLSPATWNAMADGNPVLNDCVDQRLVRPKNRSI